MIVRWKKREYYKGNSNGNYHDSREEEGDNYEAIIKVNTKEVGKGISTKVMIMVINKDVEKRKSR